MPATIPASPSYGFSGQFRTAGYLIGLSLGGFFDGILLHQVLQWHHLLSLVDSPSARDIRTQILADGLFHVLMYLIALVGLICLWRSRRDFAQTHAGRWLAGAALVGFGVWNIIDVGLFHWILGIHRIRVDVPNPMFWDLLWLFVFGLPFLMAGLFICRKANARRRRAGMSESSAAIVSAVVLGAGVLAALPPDGNGETLVVFGPSTTPQQVYQAFDLVDARVLWADRSGTVWAVRMTESQSSWQLYRNGAVLVTNSMVGMGCLSWTKA